MKITPSPALIRAFQNQCLPWHLILGEFIDNSFDAGAKRVSISFDNNRLVIEDDGVGCPDMILFFAPGRREQKKTTELGRYGIGVKDAAISAAGSILVTSVHKGIMRSTSCDWRLLEKKDDWEIDDPEESPAQDKPGTKIVLHPLRSDRLKNPQELIGKLSLQYSPAVRSGRQILFQASKRQKPVPIPEYNFPPLEHQLTAELNVGGKGARVTMGIIPEGQVVKESGLIISHGFRVLLTGQRIGLGDEPTPGLFGWVELASGWELAKNKDKVSSNLQQLGDAIYRAFQPTIQKAAKRGQLLTFDKVTKEINSLLQEFQDETKKGKRKAKRTGPQIASGTISPNGRGGRHRRASVTQPGSTFEEACGSSRGLQITFDSFGLTGPASKYQDGVIYLNKDLPALQADAHNLKAITCHAIYAAAAYFALNDGRFSFLREAETDFERISMIAGHLLARMESGLAEEVRETA